MNEAPRVKLDLTVNLPILGGIIAAAIAVGVWVNSVNVKLDSVAEVVKAQTANNDRLDKMEATLAAEILKNRAETLENRRVYQEGER